MKITIRRENKKDYRAVEELTREAFWNLHTPGCDEHYLVHKMRNHPDFIEKLDYVAEYDNRIIGNIMYTKAWLLNEEQKKEIVSFGPVCVLPEYQRKGIGSQLIHHTMEILKADKIPAIVIYGSPHNYCKFGFKNGKDYNISDMNGNYPYAMLVLELEKNAFDNRHWKFQYSSVCDIDKNEAEKFDNTFPKKEKKVQYSQEIFSISIRSFLK